MRTVIDTLVHSNAATTATTTATDNNKAQPSTDITSGISNITNSQLQPTTIPITSTGTGDAITTAISTSAQQQQSAVVIVHPDALPKASAVIVTSAEDKERMEQLQVKFIISYTSLSKVLFVKLLDLHTHTMQHMSIVELSTAVVMFVRKIQLHHNCGYIDIFMS